MKAPEHFRRLSLGYLVAAPEGGFPVSGVQVRAALPSSPTASQWFAAAVGIRGVALGLYSSIYTRAGVPLARREMRHYARMALGLAQARARSIARAAVARAGLEVAAQVALSMSTDARVAAYAAAAAFCECHHGEAGR